MSKEQASGWLAQQITNQGLIISANEIFWMSAGIFWCCLVLSGSLNHRLVQAAVAAARIDQKPVQMNWLFIPAGAYYLSAGLDAFLHDN